MKTISNLSTIGDYIRWASTEFAKNQVFLGHGSDNYWDEAVFLVLGLLKQPWDSDKAIFHCNLTDEEKEHLVTQIDLRIRKQIPVAYLLGEAWFCGLPFKVNNHTLIPRSPIGELIERGYEPWLAGEPERILDLCTGSGCIGIATALAFPYAEVDLSDISIEALAVARENVQRYELDDRVTLWESDVFDGIPAERQYDLIVSNPPYVDANDFATMPVEYQHEPKLGLVSGDDGLDICRRILKQAANRLTDNGLLIVEIGNSAETFEQLFPGSGVSWIEFEQGGHGVFALTKSQIVDGPW